MNAKSPVPAFMGDEVAQPDYAAAGVAVLPVPYEETVCWGGGTARGPEMILRASPHLEFYDEQMNNEPWRSGVWTSPALEVDGLSPEQAVLRVETRFGELMDDGKWVVMLGGEHSITPGGVRAAAARHDDLQLVQLDAHADLRESYGGTRWNHACAMARCLDHATLRAVGIRSYTAEEAERMRLGIPGYRIAHSWEMDRQGWAERLLEGIDGKPVYLTFDVDYFDPAVMPATGTPEPGGIGWFPTLAFLEELFERASVVACDVVELAPSPGLHHADFTVARLVHKLIGMHAGGRGHRK